MSDVASMIATANSEIDNFEAKIDAGASKMEVDDAERAIVKEEPNKDIPEKTEPQSKSVPEQKKSEPEVDEKIRPYEEKIKSYEKELEEIRRRNEELEVEHKIVETFKANPKGYIESNFPEFKYQSTEKGLTDKIREIKAEFEKRFGEDFLDTRSNDPDSPSFAYNYEIEKIKMQHIREEAERELNLKSSVEKQKQLLIENTRRVTNTINKLKKDNNLSDEQLKPVREIHERVWNDPISLFEELTKLYVKANFSLNNEAEKLNAQEQIEKRKKEAALSSPAGSGKSGSKQEDHEWDFLLYKNSRSS